MVFQGFHFVHTAYDVGYGKPPKHSQFKKGQSGNPKGRPKKRKSIQELIQEELDTEITVGGRTMTKAQAVVVSLVNDSIKGKPSARQTLLPLIPQEDDELENFDPSLDDQIEWHKTMRRHESQLQRQNAGGGAMSYQFYGMYRCSLGSFVDFAFRELHPGETMQDNWHIRTVADLLQFSWLNVSDELSRKLIFNLPPGHLKTHICSISFPAWILGRDPRKSVLIVSETPDMALEIRERCCELMSSKRYRYLFPRAKIVRSGKEVELNYGGRIRHAGVGYSLPQRRSDLVILDNPQSLHNLERLDPTAFVEIGRTLQNPKEGMIVLATRRLAENDLSAYLFGLRNWARIVMPVVGMQDVDWPGIYHAGHLHRKGEPLHYWHEGWEKIEQRILEIGGEAFSWQYMQGTYKPQTTGQRTYYENGVPAGFVVGSFDPTGVTRSDFALLKQKYEAEYDPMKVDLPNFPIASE